MEIILNIIGCILLIVIMPIGTMIWLFSGVIAWEFIKWHDSRKKN